MTETDLYIFDLLGAIFANTFSWLSVFTRTLWLGTVFNFTLGEIGLALGIIWALSQRW